jgi:hypothetical protein
VIKIVHINMCPILDGYGVMTAFSFPYTPSCEPRLPSDLFIISPLEGKYGVREERRGGLVRPAVTIS